MLYGGNLEYFRVDPRIRNCRGWCLRLRVTRISGNQWIRSSGWGYCSIQKSRVMAIKEEQCEVTFSWPVRPTQPRMQWCDPIMLSV